MNVEQLLDRKARGNGFGLAVVCQPMEFPVSLPLVSLLLDLVFQTQFKLHGTASQYGFE